MKATSATSASEIHRCGFVPHRLGVADRGPRRLLDAGDRPHHGGVHPRGDRELGPVAADRGEHVGAVERRVRADDHQSGRPATPRRGKRVADQPGRAAGGVGRPLAQPGRGDHRCGQRGGHRRDQRVEALHPRVAVPGALLGVAVDLPHGVVDVDVGDLPGAGQQRGVRRQRGQEPGRHRIQLPDVAEGERPQERAQRRGCPHPGHQPAHAAVAQQVQIVDGIRAGDHPRHDRGNLHRRVRPTRARQVHVLGDQVVQPAALRQRQHGRQSRTGHQIRIVKPERDPLRGVQDSHLADALLPGDVEPSASPIVPAQKGIRASERAADLKIDGGSGFQPVAGRRRAV